MSSALFQCNNDDTVLRLSAYLQENPPAGVMQTQTWPFGRLLGLSFRGDCKSVYYYGMDLIPHWPELVAFIGIDETSSVPNDHYKLTMLDTMPANKELRDRILDGYFENLKKDFIKAIFQSYFSYEEVLTITERCVLGSSGWSELDFVTKSIHTMSNQMYSVEIHEFLGSQIKPAYSDVMFNLMLRSMAHFCYLRLRKFKLN